MMLAGLSAWHAGASQIVVLGSPEETLALRTEIARRYLPFALAVPVMPGEPQRTLALVLPFVGPMLQKDGRPTAFVCKDFACREPVTAIDALASQLQPA
jgi:uncharacterized protein YyaL (SSP411 family)